MLFIHIHTHSPEHCTVNKPEENAKMMAKMETDAQKAGIKILGVYVAPHEHTIYTIFDAKDLAALEQGLIPMTLTGTARLVPVVPAEQMIK